MRGELTISVLFLILLGLMVNPFGELWMPSMKEAYLVALLVILFSVYTVYFWREKNEDEREDLHRLFAGRIAFLVGAGILVLGIGYQAYHEVLDPWLALALGSMVLSKSLARMWKARKG